MKGMIALGGFVKHPGLLESTVKMAKDSKIKIVRTHIFRRRFTPFTCYTAALRVITRIMQSNHIGLMTASWLDDIQVASQAIETNQDEESLKLYAYVVNMGRILDRVLLRYGGVYVVTSNAFSKASLTMDLDHRPDVCFYKDGATFNEAIIRLSFNNSIHPNVGWTMNLNGNVAESRFLLVGDQINPKFKHFNHWPFHDDADSAYFITSILNELMVPETRVAWANANHDSSAERESILTLLKARPSVKVVTLGRQAQLGLRSMGVESHHKLPHPSFAKRFNKRSEYVTDLRSILLSS